MQFQLTTHRTGHRRIVKVRVYDTVEEMRAACMRVGRRWQGAVPDDGFEGSIGVTIWPQPTEDADPRAHLITILLTRSELTTAILAHEALHAAGMLYLIDVLKPGSRAVGHMNGWNEQHAYLATDIFLAMLSKLGPLPDGDPIPQWYKPWAKP